MYFKKQPLMKKISTAILLLFTMSICNAQSPGSITAKEIKPKAGIENHYIYQPPKKLSIPDKIQAMVVYKNRQEFFSKKIRVDKDGNKYQFSFKAPDSTSVLIFSIVEYGKMIPEKDKATMEKKKQFDNNNETGYFIYLHDKAGKRFASENIDKAALLADYALYFLELKEKPNATLIKLYEASYKLHPEFKKENTYIDYLGLLYKENEIAARPVLLSYANQLLQGKNDEEKWRSVRYIYRMLKMTDERKVMYDKILSTFPNGNLAKGIFQDNYFFNKDKSESTMLASINEFIARFNDKSAKAMDAFYRPFILNSLTNKEWAIAFKYEKLVTNKIQSAYSFDYVARQLSDKEVNNPGTDLENAKVLSAKSIAYSTELLNGYTDLDLEDLEDAHYGFLDTYALILYKQGQYDSAFYYQNLISKQDKELNTSGMERYAAYAEKVKGIVFARQYIETKLLAGTKSTVMLKQLQAIYSQLNLPQNEFNRLQQKSLLIVKQKNEAAIKAKYGTLKARDFTLKNMAGETVTLSDLKNKVVVLDFWATWCSPCKASFPTMQQLVNKYKDDKDVVFLFIDTWESDTQQKNKETVTKYITDNKYSFNVLFDVKHKVVTDYKVEGIPKKFVLDKDGNLVYTGEESGLIFTNEHIIDDMSAIIDASKKLPIDLKH
jgi:thiol-disulfide isomerase/thioredoxin